MQIKKNNIKSKLISSVHSVIVRKIENHIERDNWGFLIPELPPGSILVGGYIRDLILNRSSLYPDVDIVVPTNSIEIGRNIAKQFSFKFLILDPEREIIRIISEKFILDIANQTNDLLVEDLKKRDLTINSIGYSFDSRQLIDPLNGTFDLQNSLLRCFDYSNIMNDPLRILRCFRFVSELNFTIEPNLLKFIELNKVQLRSVSVERIQYELKKIVKGKEALKAIIYLNQIRIFDWIQSYERNSSLFLLSINYEFLSNEEVKKYLPIVYLRELLKSKVIKEFKFSKSDSHEINSLRRWTNKLKKKSIEAFTEIERFELHKELEMILPAFILYLPSDCQNYWLKRWRNKKDRLFHPRNFINGNILKTKLGMEDGPLLGNLLEYISMEFAYERLNNFDEAIYKAKQWFQQNAPKCD